MSGLVERLLRQANAMMFPDALQPATMREAAARITALEAENELLRENLREDELFSILKDRLGKSRKGSRRMWCENAGLSEGYIMSVLHGHRRIAERLANAMGYRRVVTFEPLDKDKTNDAD